MTLDLPATAPFHLTLAFDPTAPGPDALQVEARNLHDYQEAAAPQGRLLAWGCPALDGRLLGAEELLARIGEIGAEKLADQLDCGFLIVHHDIAARRLAIISDRWASMPFYHCNRNGRFLASTSFKTLFDARKGLDPWTVAEFLYFRRIFGNRTYDNGISFVPYATVISIDADGQRESRYWRIQGGKTALDQNAQAERLAEAMRASMALHMSDGRRYGLMLSGGLDARALLAAAPAPLPCFTTTPTPNNELDVARSLAALAKAPHTYMPRQPRLPRDMVEASVALSGGMTVYHEAQFMGYGPQVTPHADTVFLGLALDIMFCGHYLPKSLAYLARRPGWHFHLNDLPTDLPGSFLDTVSYRLKTSDPWGIILPERRTEMRRQLLDRVSQEMDEGTALGLRGYDLWEFMHLHNFARHYSLLMAQSVRTFAACRLPAFTRALYDICWDMPIADKANWRVYQKAICRLNPAMMRVRNANTNIRADRPLRTQTYIKFARSLASHLPMTRVRTTPSWWNRSWPQPRQQLEDNPALLERAAALGRSETLAAVGLFDMGAIAKAIEDHNARRADHTVMINLLLTIEGALCAGTL